MATFDDWGKGESKVFDVTGEPLTPELIDEAAQAIKERRGQLREKPLSSRQFRRAKTLAKKVNDGTATPDELRELILINRG